MKEMKNNLLINKSEEQITLSEVNLNDIKLGTSLKKQKWMKDENSKTG